MSVWVKYRNKKILLLSFSLPEIQFSLSDLFILIDSTLLNSHSAAVHETQQFQEMFHNKWQTTGRLLTLKCTEEYEVYIDSKQ